jgi:hypothetical protein
MTTPQQPSKVKLYENAAGCRASRRCDDIRFPAQARCPDTVQATKADRADMMRRASVLRPLPVVTADEQ